MEQYIKQSTFRKHLNFLIERIKIALKENKEYKTNLWTYLLSDTFMVLSYLIFFFIVNKIIGHKINWTYFDFWLFFIFLAIAAKSMYNFTIRYFSRILISGKINLTKNQPINQYINESSRNFSGAGITTLLIFIGYLTISLIYYKINYTFINLLFSLIIFTFGTIYFFAYINFFESLGFFFKNTEEITRLMNNEINYMNEKFTPKMFEKTNLKYFAYSLPSAIYGYFPIEALKGNFQIFLKFLPFQLITIGIFIIGTYFLWRFGLKKYEGYN